MITETLDEEGISTRVYTIPVDDIHRHPVWVTFVESLTPPFDCVYSNEPVTSRLFREAGYTVKSTELIEREDWSGTRIRSKMLQDEPWEECVPPAVARIISEIDGIARIKELAGSDKE